MMKDYQYLLKISIEAAIRAGEKTLEYFEKEMTVATKEDNSPLTMADLESNKIINELLGPTGIPILSEENKIIPYKIRKAWELFWMVDPLDGTKEFIKQRPEYTVNIGLIENSKPVLGVIYIPAQKVLYYSIYNSGAFKVNSVSNLSYDLIIKNSVLLPLKQPSKQNIVVIASKSHLSGETISFIDELKNNLVEYELVSIGSSLKFCLLAEGLADIYPRFGPTMEWDTAAGQAIAEAANCHIMDVNNGEYLKYNKVNLYNPSFVAYNKNFTEIVRKIILLVSRLHI
jgi:3'(2'), 5'-bisphosphate nucleotidase